MVEGRDVLYPDFGARVRAAVIEHGITKKAIVKALGLKTDEMARRYIAGLAKPRHDKLVQLARLLRFTSAAELEYGDDERAPTKSARVGEREISYSDLTDEAVELARAFMRLPDFKRRQHAKAIPTDATLLDIFPELEAAMRAALVAVDPDYHKLTDGFIKSRAVIERQLKLKLET